MQEDSILQEVRQVRESHAAEFNYDLWAIYHNIKEQEKKSTKTFVSYPPKIIQPSEKIKTRFFEN